MMFFLVSDIINDIIQLRTRIRKSPVSFLPFKSPKNPLFSIDEFCRICFDVSHQIRYGGVWCYAHQNMDMIGHGIDLDDGLFFLSDDAYDITVELGFVLFWDEGLSTLNGEDNVYVDLRIGVRHDFPYRCHPYGVTWVRHMRFYTDATPTGLMPECYVPYTDETPTGFHGCGTCDSTQMPPLRG